MILLPIVLTPIGIAILLLVMSWTERGLDREPRPDRSEPAAAVAVLAPLSELAGLIEP
jgi:hypothetical protein